MESISSHYMYKHADMNLRAHNLNVITLYHYEAIYIVISMCNWRVRQTGELVTFNDFPRQLSDIQRRGLVRFVVLTAVYLNIQVFCDVIPPRHVSTQRRYEGVYCPMLKVQSVVNEWLRDLFLEEEEEEEEADSLRNCLWRSILTEVLLCCVIYWLNQLSNTINFW